MLTVYMSGAKNHFRRCHEVLSHVSKIYYCDGDWEIVPANQGCYHWRPESQLTTQHGRRLSVVSLCPCWFIYMSLS
ncbi:hypothetical protein T4D_16787 [Trichinella pseudospiralis]|uniref:Uncharacterized protein n=1 Tax=Trichinella pseudospiralis TaxID=6337 RepID=A0A0V1G5G4_TRIPS|nr:hypothetical protein T4D_16787 [Trichinella pseudospiralis]